MNKTVIKVCAPAKINLTLDILGKRTDGYHELATVMVPLSLADKLEITYQAQSKTVVDVIINVPELQNPATNLAARAATEFLRYFDLKAHVELKIEKNIPIGAGLAGGSSNAAAVLRGLHRLTGRGTTAELYQLAAELGSDVPFCLFNHPALATGRGEKLQPLKNHPNIEIIILKPHFSLSTAAVFKARSAEKNDSIPNNDAFITAWEKTDFSGMILNMGNRLEKTVTRKHPEIARLKEILISAGAQTAQMSGSGPAVFGIFPDADTADKAYRKLKNGSYFCCRTQIQGERRHDTGSTCSISVAEL